MSSCGIRVGLSTGDRHTLLYVCAILIADLSVAPAWPSWRFTPSRLNADQFVALLLNSASAITITIDVAFALLLMRASASTHSTICMNGINALPAGGLESRSVWT
jgi:hypothetical protein